MSGVEPLPRPRLYRDRPGRPAGRRAAGDSALRPARGPWGARVQTPTKHLHGCEMACSLARSAGTYPQRWQQRDDGANMRKPKGVVINGVRFKPGEVDWEDAHSATRDKLPNFAAMRQTSGYVGTKITSTGLVARIGRYLLVITEKDEALTEFDFTLIPLRAKVQIRYT